jgi:DNA-binding NarL/FixJ family response regulator
VIKLLFVDDHPVVTEGLVARFASIPGFEVVGAVASLEAALTQVTRQKVDLALVDVQLKVPTTPSGLRPLCERCGVVLFSARAIDGHVRSLLAAGAVAFADKALPLDELDVLLRRVHAGERLQPPASGAPSPLSAREEEVYRALAAGSSPKEVAGQLGLATSTVYCHLENVKKKLGLRSLQALVVHAAQHPES